MKMTFWLLGLAVLLGLLLGPVMIAQANPPATRSLQGVQLADVHYTEVKFRNSPQDIDLAGMLFVPQGDGPFPAVVIIHGAGESHRDNPWYLTLASYLQQSGILVLLPDKRGSEKSTGDWRTASFDDLASDSVAAVDYLLTQDIAPVAGVGVIGASQGGQFSPMVAARSADIAFVVNVVGTSLPLHDVLLYEESNNLRQMGFLPGIADLLAYPSTWSLRFLRQKDFWEAVGNFDPLPYWQALGVPALVMYGSLDTNVPAAASQARLLALEKANLAVKVYPGSGHPLEDPLGSGDSIFRQDALSDIVSFIHSVIPPAIAFAQPRFIFQGEDPALPIVTHNPSPAIKNRYINPGAVLFHNDRFHMFFNSFTAWPGVIQVGYMTSTDGYHWSMAQDEPVFTTQDIPFGNGNADVSSIVVMDDGLWVMYFHTIVGGEIGRATALSPFGPWKVDPQPVLRGDPHGWDSNGLTWPSVVFDDGGLRMYYAARSRLGFAIGMAVSTDGIHWTKYNQSATTDEPYALSDPVLVADADWENEKVDRPRVVKSPDGWVMIYQGSLSVAQRGLALSNDGLQWVKYAANPLFHPLDFPIPNAKTWDTTLLYHDDAYYYFMELGSLSGTDLYLTRHVGPLHK